MSDFAVGFVTGAGVAGAMALLAYAGPLERWWLERKNPPIVEARRPLSEARPSQVGRYAPPLLLEGPDE